MFKFLERRKQERAAKAAREAKVHDLEARCGAALKDIAAKLEIPGDWSERIPVILSGGGNSQQGNLIALEEGCSTSTIYEEAGHYLQSKLNPPLPFYEFSLVGIVAIKACEEAVGHFASTLSGEWRNAAYFREWSEAVRKANGSDIVFYVEGKPDTKVCKYDDEILFVEIGEAIYRSIVRANQLSSEKDLQRSIEEKLNEKHMSALRNTDMLPIRSRLFHYMGYDLGAELFDLYEKDRSHAIRLVKDLINADQHEPISAFAKAFKTFYPTRP